MAEQNNITDETGTIEAEPTEPEVEETPPPPPPPSPSPELPKRHPVWRLLIAMYVGLLTIEIVLELTAGMTLMGDRNGIFIREPLHKAKIENSELNADGKVLQTTDIRERPFLSANRVGKLERGMQLRLVGQTMVDDALWYQVQRFGGKIGYVYGNVVFIEKHIPKE